MPGEIDFSNFDYEDVTYGNVANADEYFSHKMQQLDDWSFQPSEAKQKALYEATQSIDRLLFSGYKTPVFNLLASNPKATLDEIKAADETQALQFPRDGSEDIPEEILIAVYEEAASLLSGRNPQQELEALALNSDGAGSTRFSMDRTHKPIRHLVNGITSYFAWVRIMPFLADVSTFDVRRV
jgi:hypothetical protein